jgi:hypothetical protein
MSDLMKILVTVILGVCLLAIAYTYLARNGFDLGNVTPQYGPIYMPRLR